MTTLTTATERTAAARVGTTTETVERLRGELRRVLVGKDDAVEVVLACLLAGGHLLLDDLPGTGKTTLAKAVAAAVGGRLARVQCTPDLMPADVTGFTLFNQKTREFEFRPGPVFADVLLADELNRTTPRTQSALLEAMAERQVTVDGTAKPLSPTFFVIATQNPIDSHGAYPLPEAQLDRFAVKLRIGYPDRDAQVRILERASGAAADGDAVSVDAATDLSGLAALRAGVAEVAVHPAVRGYLADLVEATRNDEGIELGVSPRGMLIWQQMARAWATLKGRDFVTPDDVRDVAPEVLSVRLLTRDDVDAAIGRVLSSVEPPDYR